MSQAQAFNVDIVESKLENLSLWWFFVDSEWKTVRVADEVLSYPKTVLQVLYQILYQILPQILYYFRSNAPRSVWPPRSER